jgi:hypothetical protein
MVPSCQWLPICNLDVRSHESFIIFHQPITSLVFHDNIQHRSAHQCSQTYPPYGINVHSVLGRIHQHYVHQSRSSAPGNTFNHLLSQAHILVGCQVHDGSLPRPTSVWFCPWRMRTAEPSRVSLNSIRHDWWICVNQTWKYSSDPEHPSLPRSTPV